MTVVMSYGIDNEFSSTSRTLVKKGNYTQAIKELEGLALTADRLAKSNALRWEAERLRRIRLDYDLTRDELFSQLKKRVNNVSKAEFEQWLNKGWFDYRLIEGKQLFISPSVSNLFFRYPEIRKRRKKPLKHTLLQFLGRIATAEKSGEKALIGPKQYRIQMELDVKAGTAKPGEKIRCWLPFPQETDYQKDIEILASDPDPFKIAPPHAPHRSVCFEKIASANKAVHFSIEYTFTCLPRLKNIEPAKVTGKIPDSIKRYLREKPPHVVFDPQFKTTLDEIVGTEPNFYLIAKKIYQWISANFSYSYAREYSTIRNISRYTYQRRYGDCGQLALLFITFCRMKGIPARWESGWMIYLDSVNLHDWCVIYLDPYGWIPVDPNMGVESMTWDTPDQETRQKVLDFYFGHMDPYRIAVNSNHSDYFTPPKIHFRSDTVDFQRGEVETVETNIYYNEFSYQLDILESESLEN